MGLLNRLRPRKEHNFCTLCGAPMASFTVLEHTGFDYYTGQPTYDTRVGWACSEGEIEQDLKYTYTYHDGWLAYYRDEWKRLNG